jgi:hypothetical protein
VCECCCYPKLQVLLGHGHIRCLQYAYVKCTAFWQVTMLLQHDAQQENEQHMFNTGRVAPSYSCAMPSAGRVFSPLKHLPPAVVAAAPAAPAACLPAPAAIVLPDAVVCALSSLNTCVHWHMQDLISKGWIWSHTVAISLSHRANPFKLKPVLSTCCPALISHAS